MITPARGLGPAAFIVVALLSTAALAQHAGPVTPTGPASEASPMFQRYHAMAGVMKQMTDEMARMQGDMANADKMTPEGRTRMAADMKRMAKMMRRMSGLADRPSMSDPQAKKEFDDMRREMDAMSKSHARAF